jgi:methylaspartate mutase epsilon subunit
MSTNGSHTILLGGIGGDSHSVGLTILRHALSARGYHVRYLGTQNSLTGFFDLASLSDVVMVSCMDGHAAYYLRNFPELLRQARFNGRAPRWYLGGNLHIGDGLGFERKFLEMGFDRVFVKFVDVNTVLEMLARDLNGTEPMAACDALWQRLQSDSPAQLWPVTDERLDPTEYERLRVEVLGQWKTGQGAKSFEANAAFLVSQPSFTSAQVRANSGRWPILVQPRSGVAQLANQIKLFEAFKGSGVRVLSYQVDSFTRNNNYAGAEEAIRESRAGGPEVNGFPVVNHGVRGLRQVIRRVGLPLQTRHSTRDPRLLAEISYAGGVTSFEGGPICYNVPYYKDYPLGESLRTWQYVDRLTGLYRERFGVMLDREFFGTLTATLIPPCLAIAVNIIEALLAARQGVKSVSLGYAEQGNRIQDVAAIRTLRAMSGEVLRNLGYTDVRVSTVFHQYMAAFPSDYRRASDLIFNSAATAKLSGATRIIVKTPVEASRIPSLADNLDGIGIVLRGLAAGGDEPVNEELVARECAIIRAEVEAILDSVIYGGKGDLAQGVVAAFAQGFLDIPFSPSIHNRGEVMTARDREGAVRFLSIGRMQFGRELREFHRDKMAERRRAEGLSREAQSYLLVERDVLQVARCEYQGWPLHK